MLKSFKYSGTSDIQCNATRRAGRHPVHSVDAARVIAEAANTDFDPPPAASSWRGESCQLIVGPGILLQGAKSSDCVIGLVIGGAENAMDCRIIRIAEGSTYSGKIEADVVEVRGTFEGELTARKLLVIHASGRVSGAIRYGALTVEKGGMLDRNITPHAMGPETAHG